MGRATTKLPPPRQSTKQLGFSLVELVTVIAVLGILAFGTTRFLTSATGGFVSTNNRSEVVSNVQATLLGLLRDVRNSLPRSIRVSTNGECLEFIPIEQGTRYISAPIGTSSADVWVVPVPGFTPVPGSRAALQSNDTAYALPNPGPISSDITSTTLEASGQLQITLSAAHQFSSGSAQERLYYVAQPISYCVDGGQFWRYQNYGFLAAQPSVVSLPTSLLNRVLVAESVDLALPVFVYTDASLERNGSLSVNLAITNDGERIELDQLIAIRNLP